jgi:gamma-glutamylcyclotransferase (GGCT)/AIG2-like uncharacterized protein YtfP
MRIFVYGTLRRNQTAYHLMEDANAEYLGEARTTNDYILYNVYDFPGMIKSHSLRLNGVRGELFEVDENNMRKINRYECVESNLFKRDVVELVDGTQAIAYFYNQDISESTLIESGIWK